VSRWELAATADAGDGALLNLYRRGGDFSLRIPGHGELMNSRTHGSEDRLGELACDALKDRPGARVLIGGLGMGFTLASALSHLAPDASVVVSEILPEVVRWNESVLGHCAGHPLRDPRVSVREDDVAALIGAAQARYDAIVLDVDNGPEGLLRRANDGLYSPAGLAAARRALTPGGTLAVWSASPDPAFAARLRRGGFTVTERPVRAHGDRGARYLVWLAVRDGAGA